MNSGSIHFHGYMQVINDEGRSIVTQVINK